MDINDWEPHTFIKTLGNLVKKRDLHKSTIINEIRWYYKKKEKLKNAESLRISEYQGTSMETHKNLWT